MLMMRPSHLAMKPAVMMRMNPAHATRSTLLAQQRVMHGCIQRIACAQRLVIQRNGCNTGLACCLQTRCVRSV